MSSHATRGTHNRANSALLVLLALALTGCPRLSLTRVDNVAPVVTVAADVATQTVAPGDVIVLSATAEDEDDGAEALKLRWSQLATDPVKVAITDANSAAASAIAPQIATTLNFVVVASDGIEESAPALVSVTIEIPENARPTALAAAEVLSVGEGDDVVLDGTSSSDPEGDPLTFTWTQVLDEGGVPVNLRDADTAVASFTAPAGGAPLFFQLVVADAVSTSLPFVVRVDVVSDVNLPPTVALASDLIDAAAGATVVLDAADSSDPEGADLSFRWEQIISGDDVPVNVLTPLSSSASFTAPNETTSLFFRVFVSDGVNTAPPAVVQVDVFVPPNIQPVASVANAERTGIFGDTVVLDGALSSDPDGDPLTFRWTQTAGAVAIPGLPATTSSFTFTAPTEATRLVFELTVDDGLIQSVPAVVIVDVIPPPNTPPEARFEDGNGNLVEILEVDGDGQVALDGSASFDADGDALSFRWVRLDNGVPVNLNPASGEAAVVSFRAPDVTTTMFFTLTVNDGRDDSVPHVVRVEITQRENLSPVIDLSNAEQIVSAEAAVVLDASGTIDPEGRTLTFRWAQVDAGNDPPVNIATSTSAVASFVAPDQDALLTFRLTVSDGVNTSIGIFTVEVVQDVLNLLPIVTPIADLVVVQTGQTVQLSCGQGVNTPGDGESEDDDCRDPDGDIVSFRWSLQSGPPGGAAIFAPATANIRNPTVRLTGRGTYFLALVATDNLNDTSLPQLVRIDVINSPPVAVAPDADTTVNGTPITLVAGGNDADGDALTFRWSLVDNPVDGRVALTDAAAAAVTFTPSKKTPVADPLDCVEGGGCYQLQLVVSDGREDSAPQTVFVTSTDRAPVANAGQDNDGDEGDIVLDGRLSFDSDGDAITTHTWRQTLGPDLGADGEPGAFTGDVVRIAAPAQALYEFELVVTADGVDSAPDRVQVSIDNINSVPVLSSSSARFVVGEAEAATFSVVVSDLDDALHEVEWTRVSGSPLFPETLLGATPNLVGPPYLALLASPEGNGAEYDVVARDPQGAVSNTLRVEIFAGPGTNQFIVLDTGPGSSTSATCGSIAEPCATLAAAVARVDPDGNGIGDNRDFIFTTQVFLLQELAVPAGTSLFGGRDPSTFQVTPLERTTLLHDNAGAAPSQIGFIRFAAAAQDAVVERMTVTFSRGVSLVRVVQCNSCDLTLRDVTINTDSSNNVAAVELNGSANATVERTSMRVRNIGDVARGLQVNGGDATVTDTDISLPIPVGCCTRATEGFSLLGGSVGTVTADRVRIEITGDDSIEVTNAIRITGGLMELRNSTIFMATPGLGSAVKQTGGGGTYLFNTIVSTGGNGNTGALELDTPSSVMGTLVQGFPIAIRMQNNNARASRVYGNITDAGDFSSCPTPLAAGDVLNPAANTDCNASQEAWTGNAIGSCPLLDPLGGDLHLNPDLTPNPCADSAPADSPAGAAPTTDLDGETRSLVTPDTGADEL